MLKSGKFMLNKNVSIRLAVPTDASIMAEVKMRSWEVAYKDFIPESFMKERRKNILSRTEHILLDEHQKLFQYVILLNDVIVGVMSLGPTQGDDTDDAVYDLQAIYVHPDYYRQGIGSMAIEHAFDIARNLSKTAMIVWVFEKNINSVNFYKKCGFVADGKTRLLEYGTLLNCIRMKREL